MIDSVLASSFRDPSGFVFLREGVLYRQVNAVFQDEFDHFVSSGLYDALVEARLIVSHEEVGLEASPRPETAYRVLRPHVVPFVSYPYEWCFSQLKDAALATLRIQAVATEHGMSLRDASAYNIQFVEGRPVLIDTLSFERIREGQPWVAYRQFCQHFLAPLALMAKRDVRLGQLLRVYLDGVPLDLAAQLLPRGARLRPGLMMHVAMHGKAQARQLPDAEQAKERKQRPMSARALQGLLDSLRNAVQKMSWDPGRTTWSHYYGQGESYAPEALEHKQHAVGEVLDRVRPRSVWDLGGNTGLFSRLATARGAHTVCFDGDAAAVELNYRQAGEEGEKLLLPLVLDLTNPSGGIGWANQERMSLAERGPADLVMALALIHHLAIGNNVPFDRVAGWWHKLGSALAVEFVPKHDPKVQTLLATREDVFPDYTREAFERAFGERFTIENRWELRGSERVLYLMRGR